MLNESHILPTPYYYYDLDQVVDNINAYKEITDNCVRILYATMANARPEILRSVKKAEIGVFVNSISHLTLARQAGINPNDIVFAGSGHETELIEFLSGAGVHYHADSIHQLEHYIKCKPNGRAGLRVNVGSLLGDFEIDPAPRLGMNTDEIESAIRQFKGNAITLHVYVGTNLLNAEMHKKCLTALYTLAKEYECVSDIDLGGGFAFAPGDDNDRGVWLEVIELWQKLHKEKPGLKLTIEPGRSIVRNAGRFFVKVTDIKKRNGKTFVMVNSSGTWFPRKIVHGYDEEFVTVSGNESKDGLLDTYICGSSTFSKDFLTKSRLPNMSIDDVICFNAAGAYNEAMHLDFLGMPKPGIVVKEHGEIKIVRETERPKVC